MIEDRTSWCLWGGVSIPGCNCRPTIISTEGKPKDLFWNDTSMTRLEFLRWLSQTNWFTACYSTRNQIVAPHCRFCKSYWRNFKMFQIFNAAWRFPRISLRDEALWRVNKRALFHRFASILPLTLFLFCFFSYARVQRSRRTSCDGPDRSLRDRESNMTQSDFGRSPGHSH